MRRIAISLAIALRLAALQAGAAEAPASIPAAVPLVAMDPATGASVVLDPTQGPTQIVFLATWCRPCLAEMPKLTDLEDRWKPDGFHLLLVAVATRQSPDRLRELLAHEPLPGRLLFDADGSVAAAFGAATLPTHVLVDRRGRIVARSGQLDAAFAQAVERLVRQEGHAQP